MRDVLNELGTWQQRQEEIAVATVVNTWGSAPRPVGSKMATTLSGGVAGSVSAGCVEGAVIEAAKDVMNSGQPRLLKFGVTDEEAWEVGLACGGEIEIFIEPFSAFESTYNRVKQYLADGQPLALVSVLEGAPEQINHKLMVLPNGETQGNLNLLPEHQKSVIDAALTRLSEEEGGIVELTDDLTLFIEVHPPPSRLIVVGAVHIAEPLITMANAAGYRTIIVDPRSAFATEERFPHADQLIREWPQRALDDLALDSASYVVVLTHDPKLDDPALIVALQSNARYVGALGSSRTNHRRLKRLRDAGLNQDALERLHAPIGIPLGGRLPAEIAVSIMAEIVKVKNTVAVRNLA